MTAKSKAIKKRVFSLAVWTWSWVISFAILSFGAKFLWDFNIWISVIMTLISTVLGAGMIYSNMKYLQEVDELQRKISLDAMGVALGVAVVGGISYSMLDITNVIAFDAEISHLVFLIGITYLGGILIGNARYK